MPLPLDSVSQCKCTLNYEKSEIVTKIAKYSLLNITDFEIESLSTHGKEEKQFFLNKLSVFPLSINGNSLFQRNHSTLDQPSAKGNSSFACTNPLNC